MQSFTHRVTCACVHVVCRPSVGEKVVPVVVGLVVGADVVGDLVGAAVVGDLVVGADVVADACTWRCPTHIRLSVGINQTLHALDTCSMR